MSRNAIERTPVVDHHVRATALVTGFLHMRLFLTIVATATGPTLQQSRNLALVERSLR